MTLDMNFFRDAVRKATGIPQWMLKPDTPRQKAIQRARATAHKVVTRYLYRSRVCKRTVVGWDLAKPGPDYTGGVLVIDDPVLGKYVIMSSAGRGFMEYKQKMWAHLANMNPLPALVTSNKFMGLPVIDDRWGVTELDK